MLNQNTIQKDPKDYNFGGLGNGNIINQDKEKMRKTLKWVQEMSKKEGCVEVLATHDPEVIPHVIEL